MSNFVAEEDTIRLLVARERVKDVPNDLKDWFDFLLATHGPWKRVTTDVRLNSLVNRESGKSVTGKTRMFISPDIDAGEIAIHSTIALINQMAGLGVYLDLIKYPVFVEMDATGYNELTPTYLPFSAFKGNQMKWSAWQDENNFHRELPLGTYNIPLSSKNRGYHVALSVVAQLKADGYTVKTMRQYPKSQGSR